MSAGERASVRGVTPPEDPEVPDADRPRDEEVQQRPLSGTAGSYRMQTSITVYFVEMSVCFVFFSKNFASTGQEPCIPCFGLPKHPD